MQPTRHVTKHKSATAREIGKLVVGGDWACANGDSEALGYVAELLAAKMPEPTHCELVELAEICKTDPARAAAAWTTLKQRVLAAKPAR